MNGAWKCVEISKFSSRNSATFTLYEQEMSNYIVMYSLSLSLCVHGTFRCVQDLSVIRWTIISTKYEIPLILPAQAKHVTQLHSLAIPKA